MPIQLIVNADDYGHTPRVSAGIRNSHLDGIVTSTSAMMNMPGVEEALQQAVQECPRMGLGVHLVLTTGGPLLPAAQKNSLMDDNHCFLDKGSLFSRLPSLDLAFVQAEWRAQVEKFVAITGHAPDHLDSHHHVSYLSPDLFQIMLELARAFHCAIRFPNGSSAVDMFSDFPPAYAHTCLERNSMLVHAFQVPHPDHSLISFYGENASLVVLRNLLEGLTEGTTEIMCHPGYSDRDLMNSSEYHLQREAEGSILTNQEIVEFIQEKCIALVNFAVLQNMVGEK
jgi:predicted glycoside hydrolase/deacetylase ChbG (UPF0249 family)